MKRIAFLTKNRILWQKIRLLSNGWAEVDLIDEIEDANGYDQVLVDLDTKNCQADDVVTVSYLKDVCDIKMPCSFEKIKATLLEKSDNTSRLRYNESTKSVFLDGKEIFLTEHELRLFLALLGGKGGYVSREKLLKDVWNGEKDLRILNVYIHYLRNKLETGGEKIILASRGEGYKIAERYLG